MSLIRTATFAAVIAVSSVAIAAASAPHTVDRAVQRLTDDAAGDVRVELHRATGVARLVQLDPAALDLSAKSTGARAMEFFERYGGVFGVVDAGAQLQAVDASTDRLGAEHVTLRQLHEGVPVFAAELKAHFDTAGRLRVVNGVFVPEIDVSTAPTVYREAAAASAVLAVAKLEGVAPEGLAVVDNDLVVFRTGLVRGVAGSAHLAWEVEVGDGAGILEFIFIDAHDGRQLDRITGVWDIERRVHENQFPNPIWTEGDPLPFVGDNPMMDTEVNLLIDASFEVHDLFANLSFGTYLSWNGNNAVMHNVWGTAFGGCPNAFAFGPGVAFCPGVVTDDVIGHEWTHNYTRATHGLIYQWQPGALNEAYSDMFGELVDLLNGTGNDSPNGARSAGACSTFGGSPPARLEVLSPAGAAGEYPAGGAQFNPTPPWSATGSVALADDGDGITSDACQPLTGSASGRIVLIDRGTCPFVEKAAAAEAAGAIGAIIVNNEGDDVLFMGGSGRRSIPSVFVGQSDGDVLKAAILNGLSVTLTQGSASDESYRWLQAEDASGFGGAIRDMWNPTCFGDPGKVSDGGYTCSENDGGGVHTNSGVPNHAFALVVDGGSFNGIDVAAIGATKAAHIWWRAMSVYQGPATDFVEHADMIELSCADLIGAALSDLTTGALSAEVITGADCDQVAAAMTAVEMRVEPLRCGFEPLLAPNPPEVPGEVVFEELFGSNPVGTWSLSNDGVFNEYDPRDWQWTVDVPEGGSGGSMFAVDSVFIGDCQPGSDDQSGVMHLDSPSIEAPFGSAAPTLLFDHWIATEAEWDGGNLKVSVDGGPWQLIPGEAFRFNPYNASLNPGSAGNSNPMASEPAFTGTDGGSVAGSWGQSQVDLRGLVRSGQSFRIRFDLGVDGCYGAVGWFLDSVEVVATPTGPRSGGRRIGG